jgi:TolB-like protein/Flp pilus assembly protein TadD
MGEVYRARDTRLGRDIAVKVLPHDVASSPDRLARFEREARAVAALNHPNIVTIHSIEDHEGVRFLTMEVIEGQSLDTHSLPGGLPVARVLEIGIGLADALAAAHEKGVVHRDLKPANVMVTRDGRLKVLDFGLAKLEAVDVDAATRATTMTAPLTAAGAVMGTVHYMAPEQLTGGSVDARADLFALGILLYEMSAGRRPFEGATLPEVCGAILHKAPPPLASVRTDLPSDFERVVARCLEKDPRQRFHAAHDVGSELRRIAKAVERGESGRTPALDTHSRRAGLDRGPAVLRHERGPGPGLSVRGDGRGDHERADACRWIRVASRTSAFRAGRSGDDLPAISRALSVGHVLEGSVRTAGARMRVTAQLTEVASGYQLWSERFDREAVDVFAIQDEIASGVVDAVKTRLSPGARSVHARQPAHDLEAYRSYLKGRHLRGIEDFGGAMRAFQDAVRLDPAHAPSWTGLAEITVLSAHMGMIPPRAACTSARKALATANELQGESAEGLHVEGFASFLERRWDAMDKAWRRAIELQPDYVLGLASYGLTLCGRQKVDEGLRLLERARQCDPLASFPYTLTGWALLESGRPDEAVRYLEDALTFEKDDASAISAACTAYIATGRFEEGIAAGERGVAVTHRAPYFIGTLGWALATVGRNEEARALLAELRARPSDSPVAVAEAWLLGALGESDEAFAVLARAEEEHQGLLCYTGQPGFDALRSDPRFAALMSRLGLSPPAHQPTHDGEQPQHHVASIAVLPFVNRSRDADDEYFSDGLADELIHMLAKVRGLRVAARASSFHFKGKDVPPADVGKALDVAALLDGSVRRAGTGCGSPCSS